MAKNYVFLMTLNLMEGIGNEVILYMAKGLPVQMEGGCQV